MPAGLPRRDAMGGGFDRSLGAGCPRVLGAAMGRGLACQVLLRGRGRASAWKRIRIVLFELGQLALHRRAGRQQLAERIGDGADHEALGENLVCRRLVILVGGERCGEIMDQPGRRLQLLGLDAASISVPQQKRAALGFSFHSDPNDAALLCVRKALAQA